MKKFEDAQEFRDFLLDYLDSMNVEEALVDDEVIDDLGDINTKNVHGQMNIASFDLILGEQDGNPLNDNQTFRVIITEIPSGR